MGRPLGPGAGIVLGCGSKDRLTRGNTSDYAPRPSAMPEYASQTGNNPSTGVLAMYSTAAQNGITSLEPLT